MRNKDSKEEQGEKLRGEGNKEKKKKEEKEWGGQSCQKSNLLHGPESSNQILPREKHVNHDIFSA